MSVTTLSRQAQLVVIGVDTHSQTHDVTVLAVDGRWLGARAFPADTAGYRELLSFAASFGGVTRAGIELTGAYGAGLARFLTGQGVEVRDVDIPHPFVT